MVARSVSEFMPESGKRGKLSPRCTGIRATLNDVLPDQPIPYSDRYRNLPSGVHPFNHMSPAPMSTALPPCVGYAMQAREGVSPIETAKRAINHFPSGETLCREMMDSGETFTRWEPCSSTW